MKRLLEMLVQDEKALYEKSLDLSTARTKQAKEKIATVRRFLEEHCYFNEEAEERWKGLEPWRRQRVLADLLWRANCILDKSETAVLGLSAFNIGHSFKLSHTILNQEEEAFVVV